MIPVWLPLLLAHFQLTLQHLTYQDLSQGVGSVEGRFPAGRGVVSLHYKNDRFLQRWRWQHEGLWAWHRWPLELRWGLTREGSQRSHSHQVSGELRYTHLWGRWHFTPGLRAHRFVTSREARTDLGPTLRLEGPLGPGTTTLDLRYTTLFRRLSLQWLRTGNPSATLQLLDFRYPLSRETEHQREALLNLQGRLGAATSPGEITLDLTGEHHRFRWDQVRSGTRLAGRLRLELHLQPHRRAGLEIARSAYHYLQFPGLSRWREQIAYAETREQLHGGPLEAHLRLVLQQRDPSPVFAFNQRDRRILRTEIRWQPSLDPLPRVDLHFLGKITDEVYLHPTRSAYTRQDQTYRLTATTLSSFWTHRTEIAALYSLYRFAPARNLLIRYLQTSLEHSGERLRLLFRFRWQQNGTYHQEVETRQWVFVLRREIVEGRFALGIQTLRWGSLRGWILGELLDRQDRTPGERFQRQQWERAMGVRVDAPGFHLELKRIRRNRERAFWAASLSWQVSG